MDISSLEISICAVQGYGSDYQKEDNFGAYKALMDEGITFVDTAEVGPPLHRASANGL